MSSEQTPCHGRAVTGTSETSHLSLFRFPKALSSPWFHVVFSITWWDRQCKQLTSAFFSWFEEMVPSPGTIASRWMADRQVHGCGTCPTWVGIPAPSITIWLVLDKLPQLVSLGFYIHSNDLECLKWGLRHIAQCLSSNRCLKNGGNFFSREKFTWGKNLGKSWESPLSIFIMTAVDMLWGAAHHPPSTPLWPCWGSWFILSALPLIAAS